MRFILLVFLMVFQVFFLSAKKKAGSELNLMADLSKLSDMPKKVSITISDLSNSYTIYDSCSIIKNNLHFKIVLHEPKFFKLTFLWQTHSPTFISFWADASELTLILEKNLQPKLKKIYPLNSGFIETDKKVQDLKQKYDSLIKKVEYKNRPIEDVENEVLILKNELNTHIEEDIYKKTISLYKSSAIGLFALWRYAQTPYSNSRIKSDPDYIKSLYQSLDHSVRTLPSGVLLIKKIEEAKKIVKEQEFIPEVILKDTTGINEIYLSDYKGKYLLINFWASWCVPCRAEHPNLIKIYNKYYSRGFNIVSVSLDREIDKIKWLTAIKEDQIGLWTNTSDFTEKAKSIFGVSVVPSNFLINPEGKIIGKNIMDETLILKLEELFP